MRIYLYQLIGDKRYLNKNPFIKSLGVEGDPTDSATGEYYINAQIMDDTSIVNPTFCFSYHSTWLNWTTLNSCNYLWCQDTLRWYYVNDVILSQNKIYMKCHVDVLMTYREYIIKKNAVIKRTNAETDVGKSRYNKYLVDDKYKSYAPEVIWAKNFHKTTNQGFDNTVTHFVMCVVGQTTAQNRSKKKEGETDGVISSETT